MPAISTPTPRKFLQGFFVPTLLAVILFSQQGFAQPFEWQLRPFKVDLTFPNLDLLNPFTSGINAPVFQFVDIDGDGDPVGDLDLFLLDYDGRLNYYKNIGDRQNPVYVLQRFDLFEDPFEAGAEPIDVGSWFRFVDIDADGDYDLFCNAQSSRVKFYRNIGTRINPIFELESGTVLTADSTLMLSESISVPTFADVDGDGDLDFFSGNSVGSIWYYENIGTPQVFQFRFVTETYQGITIIGTRQSSVGMPLPVQQKTALHGAMVIDFADIDKDDDLDLFWGDLFSRSLYFLENTGSDTQAVFVLRDSTYQKPNAIQTTGFNMPQIVDIDNDFKLDLFVGVLFASTVDNFQYYRNDKTVDTTRFLLTKLNFIPTIDVGAASSPVFADVDGDGDQDLLIGSEDGMLVQFDRVGVGASLRYTYNTTPRYTFSGLFNISPAFGDIDGDGKLDLLVGEANGRLHLYRGSKSTAEDTTFPLSSVSYGQNAAPALFDIDNNGTLDLFVGTGGGRLYFYRNEGTPAVPQFALESAFFDSIDAGDDAKPTVADVDFDGDGDLIVGSRDSSLFYYRNDNGTFHRVPNFFAGVLSLPRAAAALHDYDGDGDPDLFLGNYKGGLLFYKNNNPLTSVEPFQQPTEFQLYQNYPNPFNPATNFGFRIPDFGLVKLAVYDLLGREIATLVNEKRAPGEYTVQWDASGYPSGVYFYRLSAGEFVETKKAVLVK